MPSISEAIIEKPPNFIVAGAGESGTTSLYCYLKQHPQVFMSPVKEPNFFAADDIVSLPNFKPLTDQEITATLTEAERQTYANEPISITITKWKDYLRLFRNVGDQVAIGEASVMYLWFPSSAAAIHRRLPRTKLIFVLRDPVERLHTLYLRTLHTGHRVTFRDWVLQAMGTKPDRRRGMQRHPIPLDCGLYATHLQRFFALFPREQIRVYLYETYCADARGVLRDIFDFLGVDANHAIDLSHQCHETRVPRFPMLYRLRRRVAGNTPLSRWLPARMSRTMREMFYSRGKKQFPLSADDRRLVVDYYRDEILQTQDLIGRNLSAWLE
ncbi:MAG: sulfotransferase [Nibricoccus sp.]